MNRSPNIRAVLIRIIRLLLAPRLITHDERTLRRIAREEAQEAIHAHERRLARGDRR